MIDKKILEDLIKDGWRFWKDDPPPEMGVVHAMFLESSIFSPGAVVQADVCEINCGVIGDTNPTLWKSI